MSFIDNKSALDFLATHHKAKIDATNKIVQYLSTKHRKVEPASIKGSALLKTIEFSQVTTWDCGFCVVQKGLECLSRKIYHMGTTGKEDSILPMLEKIATGRIKKLSKPHGEGYESEYLGRGHFRWDDSAVTLTEFELEILREMLRN